MLLVFIVSVIATFLITVLLLRKFIPVLISKKMGQPILEIGPRWHKSKEGTPTMGGLFFICAILAVSAVLSFFAFPKESLPKVWITLGMALLFGLIGFVDDRAKLKKKQNEGLLPYQKFVLQVAVAALYLFLMTAVGAIRTEVAIPFVGRSIELGNAYYGFAILMIAGVNNSVNLTDGIDGLCASVTAVVAAFFAVCGFAYPMTHTPLPVDGDTLSLLSGIVFGAALGFLFYNWYPARVFMGDTGSLFFGGLLTGLAFLMDLPILILVICIFFIFETVSVILQVVFFKLTHGKRLFKMAPFHHHLEKCGWAETKIVLLAVIITALVSAISYCFL